MATKSGLNPRVPRNFSRLRVTRRGDDADAYGSLLGVRMVHVEAELPTLLGGGVKIEPRGKDTVSINGKDPSPRPLHRGRTDLGARDPMVRF